MIQRICNLSKSNSFFLFGPRGTGKSTLLRGWKKGLSCFSVDLLDPATELRYSSNPASLLDDWKAQKTEWIFIDEIQKIPKLLDVVHLGIEKHKIKFALTGSSARKLRRGAANLLGGRAFDFHLHPFTSTELKNDFKLLPSLTYGTLPKIFEFDDVKDKKRYLYSYVSTYLKEEILVEQIVRKIEPFRKFLEVAGQMNGKILNHASIARDAGIEERSVQRYYQILDDTLLGFLLEPYHASVRKRQSKKSKFYFFDCGVARALQNTLELELAPQTPAFGDLFEQFVINEFIRLNDYQEKRCRFSYLKTKDDVEIDLIIERPGQPITLIEIKSKSSITASDVKPLLAIAKDIKKSRCYVLSTMQTESEIEGVRCLPWEKGLKEILK